jgi:hypothetical protein
MIHHAADAELMEIVPDPSRAGLGRGSRRTIRLADRYAVISNG